MTEQRANRRVIHGTCRLHGGPVGFTNLVVTKQAALVVFDPHVDGSCVISIDEAAARQLYEALREWLR